MIEIQVARRDSVVSTFRDAAFRTLHQMQSQSGMNLEGEPASASDNAVNLRQVCVKNLEKMEQTIEGEAKDLRGLKVRHMVDGWEGKIIGLNRDGSVRVLVNGEPEEVAVSQEDVEDSPEEEVSEAAPLNKDVSKKSLKERMKDVKAKLPGLPSIGQPLAHLAMRPFRRAMEDFSSSSIRTVNKHTKMPTYVSRNERNPCMLRLLNQRNHPNLELPKFALREDEVELHFLIPVRNRVVFNDEWVVNANGASNAVAADGSEDGNFFNSALGRARGAPAAVKVERLEGVLTPGFGGDFNEIPNKLPGRPVDFKKFF